MASIDRNAPCPCGSGKKYKKCHGAVTVLNTQFTYEKIRRTEAEASDYLIKFVIQQYGKEGVLRAWKDYCLDDDAPFNPSEPEEDPFDRWLTFNWAPEDEETVPELFLRKKGNSISSDVRTMIETTANSPYSFFQVVEVEPGSGMLVRDIFLKQEFRVEERTASRTMHRGDIFYARPVSLSGIWFLMGCGHMGIPAIKMDELIDLREELEKETIAETDGLTVEDLLDFEEDLRALYFDMVDEMKNRKLEIRNTDGDPLEFHTLTYTIPSPVEAFHALKDLEQKVMPGSDEELMAPDEKGEIVLHWLRAGFKGGAGENTDLGTIRIGESTMIVETNSEKRSKTVQQEIKKRMGDAAILVKEETKSHEGFMKELESKQGSPEPPGESFHDRIMRESPEAQKVIQTMMEKHWTTWPDIPLPALRGMTPREAAQDATGRELLESLLMEFEHHNETQNDPLLRVDLAKLRRELGLGNP